MEVTEHWDRLPGGAVGSPSFEILKTRHNSAQPSIDDPALAHQS